jgi:hypothetical protein
LRVGCRSSCRKPDQRKPEQERHCAMSTHVHPFLSLARAGKGWYCSLRSWSNEARHRVAGLMSMKTCRRASS